MNVKGYGKGREKGRTTIPVGGIQTSTSDSDSRMGNRGVKRKVEESEIEDGKVDAHLGIPVPPPKTPIAQPSRPGVTTSRWLTKVIGGQEYIIIDDDDDDDEPDTMIHEATPTKGAAKFAPKPKKSKRRRPRNAVSRPGNIKHGHMEINGPLPSHDVEIETSDWEDEATVEHELQVDEVEYDELLSSEDEDDNTSLSEASTVEIPEPEQFTMVRRM